jgi:hypothetical protein
MNVSNEFVIQQSEIKMSSIYYMSNTSFLTFCIPACDGLFFYSPAAADMLSAVTVIIVTDRKELP